MRFNAIKWGQKKMKKIPIFSRFLPPNFTHFFPVLLLRQSRSSKDVHERSYQEELEAKLLEAIRELGEIKKELGEMKKERDEIKKELKEIGDRETAVTTTTAPAPTNAPSFSEGDLVLAKYQNYRDTFNGRIAKVNGDGTYAVEFYDGDRDDNVEEASIKLAGRIGRKKMKLAKVEGFTPKQEEEEDSEEDLEEEEEQQVEVVAAESTNGDNSVVSLERSDFFTRAEVNNAYPNLQMSTFGGTGMKTTTLEESDVGIIHLALKEEMNSSTMTNATISDNKLQIRFFKATGKRTKHRKSNNERSVERLRDSLQTEGNKKAKETFPFFWEPRSTETNPGGALICYYGHFKLVSIVMKALSKHHALADGIERCAEVLLELVEYDETFVQRIK
ncbi:hypothetical protein TrCOL_g11941 [Triparma columacea]|uniref:Tudor domain-containing protein n=1 Tax=Triparma columacea TaxID=722753 RepID=A0A9W7GMW6_9STRA|nr:hypothetical protein TrCOL_g11941 [Triparma columacea]